MRKIGYVFIFILTIYFLSFLFLGKASLINQLVKDSHSSYNKFEWTKDIYILTNFNPDIQSKAKLDEIISSDSVVIDFINFENIYDCDTKDFKVDTYYYFLFSSFYSPLIKVDEIENVNEYMAAWEKKYFWVFYKWIKLKDLMIGIS